MTPVFEIEYADDPADLFKSPSDLSVLIDYTTAIAVECPAFARLDDIAKRSNTVLMRNFCWAAVAVWTTLLLLLFPGSFRLDVNRWQCRIAISLQYQRSM